MPSALNATRYAALGAALIAMSYGLARFAFGLYVPAIRVDLGLSPEIIGRIGAMPYLSFCFASVFAAGVVDRLGARGAALAACLSGMLGLAVMSEAQNAWTLAAGVFACGICTGLMMPALTGGMQVAVRPAVHGRVGAIMNAGTSLGVVIAVPTALWLASQWRGSYIGFAAVAGFCALLAWWFLPSSAGVEHAPAGHGPVSSGRKALRRLALFAFGMGLTSSAYWVFAPDLITTVGDLPDRASAWLWLTLGLAGLLAGAAASDLADRIGIALTQGLALATMSATLAIIALWHGSLFAVLASAALFGAVYMMLTGIHLVTGVRLLPHHPSLGPVIPFLAIALGQAAGSLLVGILETRLGYVHAFLVIAAVGLALALSSRWFPTTRPADDE
ncbi:MAG: MFS transporter [Gammaproteobacteria bacterium]|jgi:predicted MFS family arabinose efflux permease|nr:MFS transporter [Gammaproteobacteria bacterium]